MAETELSLIFPQRFGDSVHGRLPGDHVLTSIAVPSTTPELKTERLLLRGWRASDRGPFAAMNAEPQVVEQLPAALSRPESDALADRIEAHFKMHGFGFWVIETVNTEFVGFVGLAVPTFKSHFSPAVEIGWRLNPKHWGQGYATEGGRAALEYAFEQLDLEEIVSFTATENRRSRGVMERLGMSRDPADDFDHPQLPPEHRLSRHVLYRIDPPRAPLVSGVRLV